MNEKSDESYVIGLCDSILNRTARRQHRFEFLRGDPGNALSRMEHIRASSSAAVTSVLKVCTSAKMRSPVFRCIPGEARPAYLAALVRTEWFWGRLKDVTKGALPYADDCSALVTNPKLTSSKELESWQNNGMHRDRDRGFLEVFLHPVGLLWNPRHTPAFPGLSFEQFGGKTAPTFD